MQPAFANTAAPATGSPTRFPDAPQRRNIASCTTCHTLKAANATGGIDLDAFQPDQATVIDNVSNGNTGGMPDFSLQLTKAQINNVAAYVFCVTHGHTPQNC